MSDSIIIITVLIGLLVWREIHWSVVSHKLIDKLMSRNYYEYKQAESPNEPLRSKQVSDEPREDIEGALRDFQPL